MTTPRRDVIRQIRVIIGRFQNWGEKETASSWQKVEVEDWLRKNRENDRVKRVEEKILERVVEICLIVSQRIR